MNNKFTPSQNSHLKLMQAVVKTIQESKPMILKGGTALMLGYGLDRFSEDLDFDVRSDYKGRHNASLKSKLENIKGDGFSINNVVIRKDTNTVNRYRIDYTNAIGDSDSLKVEISYRTPINADRVASINGIDIVPIEDIAEFKIGAVIDAANDSRTKARDLYDANYILSHFPQAISYEQLLRLNQIDIVSLQERYATAFSIDRILSNIDSNDVILELSINSQKVLEDRVHQYESLLSKDNKEALDFLKEMIEVRFSGEPEKQIASQLEIREKLPDIVSGKINLPPIPSSPDHDKGR